MKKALILSGLFLIFALPLNDGFRVETELRHWQKCHKHGLGLSWFSTQFDSGSLFLIMEEIWKEIEGYEGYYEISTFGRVRTVDRIIIQSFGGLNRKCLYKRKPVKLFVEKSGYPTCTISLNGKVKSFRIHRLVAVAFIPNPEKKKTVNHKDGNKLNNNDWNLEWATQLENNLHAVINDLIKRNPRKGLPNKMAISQYLISGERVKDYKSISLAARENGFKQTSISKCIAGKSKTSYGYVWKQKEGQ